MRRLLLALGLLLLPGIAHATCPVIPFVFPATSINPLQVNANFTSVRDCINGILGSGIFGPATSTLNEITSWNNITGTLLRQGAAGITDNRTALGNGAAFTGLSKPGITAIDVANITCGNCGYTEYDAVRGVTTMAAGSSVVNGTGIAGYIRNQIASGGLSKNAVAVLGMGTCEVDDCKTWAFNTVLIDSDTYVAGTAVNRAIIGWESDFNVVNPATLVVGLNMTGAALAQPNLATAYQAAPLDQSGGATPIHWSFGFATTGGAATTAFYAGPAAASGTSVNSQPIDLGYIDSTSAAKIIRQVALAGSPPTLFLQASGGMVNLALDGVGSGILIGGKPAIAVDGAGNLLVGSDATTTAVLIGNTQPITINAGTDPLILTSTLLNFPTLPAAAAGLGKNFLCIDAATHVVFEGTGVSCN